MSEIKWTGGKSVRIINKASEFYDLVEYHTIPKQNKTFQLTLTLDPKQISRDINGKDIIFNK